MSSAGQVAVGASFLFLGWILLKRVQIFSPIGNSSLLETGVVVAERGAKEHHAIFPELEVPGPMC